MVKPLDTERLYDIIEMSARFNFLRNNVATFKNVSDRGFSSTDIGIYRFIFILNAGIT